MCDLVFDFGFGEGGAVVDAPVDRLESAIDEALLEEAVERLESASLVVAGHGLVGLVPAAEAADALKLRGLQIDVLLRVGAAGIEDVGNRHLQLFAAELLVDLDLDGQAVAVVAGDVGGVEAGHGLRLDDEVFESLVQRVAKVNGAVGVGRAVVEQVGGSAGAGFAQLLIEAQRGPPLRAEEAHSGADWPSSGRRSGARLRSPSTPALETLELPESVKRSCIL